MRRVFSILIVSGLLTWIGVNKVFAQADPFGVNDLTSTELGTKPIAETVAGIINIFLGLLGILAVILILYGGFIWMTSRGEVDKVQRAKTIMISAVIGLVIVLSAYAIARFIVSSLVEETSGGQGGNGQNDPNIPTCPEPADPDEIIICDIRPEQGTVGSYVTIIGWHFGDLPGQVDFNGNVAELVTCGGNPIWNNHKAKAKVLDLPLGGYVINLTSSDNRASGEIADNFTIIDGLPGLNVACLDPDFGPAGLQHVSVEGVGFSDNGSVTMTSWNNGEQQVVLNFNSWSDTELDIDIDLNALSSNIIVTNANGTDSDYFTVTCNDNNDCASLCCSSNSCRPLNICEGSGGGMPHISYISPDNGTGGNLVTIFGYNFGDMVGSVYFSDAMNNRILGVPPTNFNPQCAADYWHDDYIIIGLPAGVADGQVDVLTSDGNYSNAVDFDENGITRPGICSLSSDSGYYEDVINIEGINFPNNPNAEISFGTIPSYDTNVINPPTEATAEVPNVIGEASVQLENLLNNELSNPYPFTALVPEEGLPIITEVSPSSGPVGQYITVMGANFGQVQGQLKFDNSDGDFDFPPQCSNSFWQSDRIVVKVPSIPLNTYDLTVIRNSDGAVSNEYGFNVIGGTPGPGLCLVEPDNGPAGLEVNFFGDNFGNNQGQVIFYNNQNANFTTWNNQQVLYTSVPDNAGTGPVKVVDSNGVDSNSMVFEVGSCSNNSDCDPGETCCPGNTGSYCAVDCGPVQNQCIYSWTIETEAEPFGLYYNYNCNNDLQSPSPWPDDLDGYNSEDAYVGISLVALFTRDVVDADLGGGNNFRVWQCTNRNTGCNTAINGSLEIVNHNSSHEGVVFTPDNSLQPNTWYQVNLGLFHSQVGGDTWQPADDHFWNFRTRDNTDVCEVINIAVTPQSPAADLYLGQSRNFTASPQADNCNMCSDEYNWNWDLTTNAGQATISPINNVNVHHGRTELTADGVTENLIPNYVELRATIANFNLTDISRPIIMAPNLLIMDYWPFCDDSCDNAAVGVEFNTELDPVTVDTTNFYIVDLNTNNNITTGALLEGGDRIVTIQHTPLVLGHSYEVTVTTNVQSLYGDSLDNIHIWQFTVGNENCQFESVEVKPDNYITHNYNNIAYSAYPYSNRGICGGQPLECNEFCTWDWSSTDNNVATIDTGFQSVPATPVDNGNTNIWVNVTQDGDTVPGSDILTVDINEEQPPIYDNPFVVDHLPVDGQMNFCPNAAISITFSEVMDRDSVRDYVKIYGDAQNDPPTIEVDGSFMFRDFDSNNDNINDQTEVIFNPVDYLATSTEHLVFVDGRVESANGLPLDPTTYNDNINGQDGYSWRFTTGDHICQINYTIINPDPDWFTCSRDDCPNDVNGGLAGNQHSYLAQTYDIAGTLLNGNLLDHLWSVNNNLIILENDNLQEIEATPFNDNGVEVINVIVSAVDEGWADDSAQVNLFLCENPWPSLQGFPWAENDYNFSDYYCQSSGRGDEESLPYITYPPVETNPIPEGVLKEYIFLINGELTFKGSNLANQRLGSLAFAKQEVDQSWWNKLARLFKSDTAQGAQDYGRPAAPTNLRYESFSSQEVVLRWNDISHDEDGFGIQRRNLNGLWGEIGTVGANQDTFTDDTVVEGEVYSYRIFAFNGSGNSAFSNIVTVRATDEEPSIDVIAIRIMPNTEHLSINGWYQHYAPNPNQSGQYLEVNGYQALQVGNTIYVSATNVVDNHIYTNVYILAYNIGASLQTQEIFSQLVNNFKLNINLDLEDNICHWDPTLNCSNDFDCPNADWCHDRGLALRRDTKRLGGLIDLRDLLEVYGQLHKACDNNGNISCDNDGQCPGNGNCMPYYPRLNAGTFVAGISTSVWPSWQETLGQSLNMSLGIDPINLFNGCPEGADPDTCWDENNLEFTCPLNSLIYFYNNLLAGMSYDIGSNFEYDQDPDPNISATFANNLFPVGVNAIPRVSSNLIAYCDSSTYNDPGFPGDPDCGNGVVDGGEECDGNFRDHMCDEVLWPEDWWNEQRAGCYPAGALNCYCSDGQYDNQADCEANAGFWDCDLVECTWYDLQLTPEQCGGYCRDGFLETMYELCERIENIDDFNGVEYSCAPDNGPVTCSAITCQPICNNGTPATACLDGTWTPLAEECDPTGSPDGLDGWDCTEDGNIYCNNSCQRSCDVGDPYEGFCGDGNVDDAEECDFFGYQAPTPSESNSNNAYACTEACTFTYEFCGNVILEYEFEELCDYDVDTNNCNIGYNRPDPPDSSEYYQYCCRRIDQGVYTRCTPTAAGWCGDNIRQNTFEEYCDGSDYNDQPTPENSGPDLQYLCADTCLTSTGGWCGDGIRQEHFGAGEPEECDDVDDNNDNVCTDDCQWTCWDNGGGQPAGDVIIEPVVFGNIPAGYFEPPGGSTTINLPACRVSGNILTDVFIDTGVAATTGIVFVSDRSGSMGGMIGALREAIAGDGNAIDTIFNLNPIAEIALVSYGTNANLDSDFRDIGEVDILKTIVNNYSANMGGTNHLNALQMALDTFNAGPNYDNKLVIFMSDGGTASNTVIVKANELKTTAGIDLFTVALTTTNSLITFMNGISSSACDCSGDNCEASFGACSDGHTYCASNNYANFEECDGQAGCGPACQWNDNHKKRAYHGTTEQELEGMYQSIAGSIPIDTIKITLNDVPYTISDDNGDGYVWDFPIGTGFLNANHCEEYSGDNVIDFKVSFDGGAGSSVLFFDAEYNFCPWVNNDYY